MIDVVRDCFVFCKQKTAYDMRISDWSSDVCSSDLPGELHAQHQAIVRIIGVSDAKGVAHPLGRDGMHLYLHLFGQRRACRQAADHKAENEASRRDRKSVV